MGTGMRTITATADIDKLFKAGRRASHALVVVLAADSPEARDQRGRVVFVAGRKLGGAVVRNRCKRVMRESCRRTGGPWPGKDVALVARAGIATATPDEIDEAMRGLIARLKVGSA
jgi:ribonuclease P protein component